MSLILKSKEPEKIIQHVYYCLGKETIPYQDLVFFMAYELKLFSPTNCEKILSISKERGLIDISPEKVVTFNVQVIEKEGKAKEGPISVVDILKELSTSKMMTKSVLIKDEMILDFSYDARKNVLNAKYSGRDGNNLVLIVDGKKKEIIQEHEEDLGDLTGKKLFYKYLIKTFLKYQDDPEITQVAKEIHSNLDEWTFVYKKIEKK